MGRDQTEPSLRLENGELACKYGIGEPPPDRESWAEEQAELRAEMGGRGSRLRSDMRGGDDR